MDAHAYPLAPSTPRQPLPPPLQPSSLQTQFQWIYASDDRIVLFWSTHTECECSSEPVPMFLLTGGNCTASQFPYSGPADKGGRRASQRQNGCSVVPEHPLGTPWAESGIPFDEPDVLHSSYPAVSSQILFTTTTYGCLHVERITACHCFYTYT